MWPALIASLLGALITVTGIFAVRLREDWAQANKGKLLGFAAGLLITVSCLHLIPEASHENRLSGVSLLGGFLFLYLLTRLIGATAQPGLEDNRALGLVALVGIGFHSFIDGVLFSIGFSIDTATGLLIAPGMILHEFVEGILIYKLLLFGDFPRKQALGLAIVSAALTTPLGVLVSWPLIVELEPHLTGALISAAAGSLLYMGASHLLPQSGLLKGRNSMAVFAGVVVAAFIVSLRQH